MASQQDEARCDERKRAILDRQLNGIQSQEKQSINVFAYATLADKIILSVSSACAIFAGALNPLVPVIYGLLVSVFNGFTAGTVTEGELRSKLSTFNLYYVYLSIGLFVFHYVATVGFYYSGDHMARALRTAYLSAIMRQNMAFFDLLEPGEITNRTMSDMGTVQEAVTSKISVLLSAIATFYAAFAVAFIMYWKTALIMSPFFVAMGASASIGGAYSVKYHKRAMKLYSQASGVAEEAISAIRYVTAFGIQGLLSQRYLSVLEQVAEVNSKAENIVAALIAWMNAMPCLLYALSFWAGSKFLVKGEVSGAEITATTLAVTIGPFAIIRIAPSAQALTSGVAIAGEVLKAIARRSPQDLLTEDGQQPPGMVGNVQLDEVGLVYPSRDDVKVLKNVTLTCAAMKKTAIVGPSGSGKSSILGLVERFYEPTSGTVMLDGRDVQTLNLRWLRRQLALVDQNPVLFNASIFENIQYGCSGTLDRLSEAEKYQKVTEASKKANAHDFIMALPDGYQAQVGEKGLQLSGGQRQRIAIARALIKDPKILLLDEATSALDSKSEATVQAALDGASEHRTTIIIAHRLSTIRNADKIIVLAEGRVVEEGSHNELIARNGVYASLVQKQQIEDTKKGTATDATRLSVDGVHSTTSKNRAETTTGKYVHQPSAKQTLSFIGRMSRTDWKLLLFGLICALLAGAGIPVQAVFFAELLTVIGYPPSQYGQLKHQVTVWSGVYVALAGAAFISWMGVEVTSQSTDDLAGMGGPVIGGILTFIATILGGIVLSLAVGWKLALVCTATIPVVVVCGWLRLQVLAAFDTKIRHSGLDSAAYAGELVRSVRTVASLGLEEYALARYDGFVTKQAAKSLRSILVASALYAASQSIVYLCAALGFWYGGTLIANREYSEFQVYICFVSLISGHKLLAMHASQELQMIIDLKPTINNASQGLITSTGYNDVKGGHHQDINACRIEFENVVFSYPSRPTRRALDNLSITVEPSQTLALVGQSGSGKSTCVSLLERFYEPDQGRILIDGQDIRQRDVDEHRRTISLVSQETVMFSGTIRENIAIGLAGEEVSDDNILAACKQANILEFVESLPDGLSTLVGTGGSMLSGGQKQRIAIARAFLRRPKILLLGEATSALDTESEAIVQAAMDAIRKDRITIMVAHRLSTIRNADVICVLQDGALVREAMNS
ncbi:ABC transporter ATP-binding protein [Aspergillus alliaceus]|uniref:ABC transporter ATP-binding protein n=1 Tax=Petromyces alliaceus TaxID=209559 RepID=UPI0012A3EE10|nr:P-loop containing nucleoside triphosphate hydrolase protein [Aspergillus alliaceus]KAB8239515.1 P-loop containing nucleoside triphosphate hydrolase protein [Aspergillus alliaceus]